MSMIDLDRVARYVELGFDKEDAVKRVEKETKEEMKKNQSTSDDDDVKPDVNLDDYIKKDEVESMIQKRLEEEKIKNVEISPPPEQKESIDDLMNKFF